MIGRRYRAGRQAETTAEIDDGMNDAVHVDDAEYLFGGFREGGYGYGAVTALHRRERQGATPMIERERKQ